MEGLILTQKGSGEVFLLEKKNMPHYIFFCFKLNITCRQCMFLRIRNTAKNNFYWFRFFQVLWKLCTKRDLNGNVCELGAT